MTTDFSQLVIRLATEIIEEHGLELDGPLSGETQLFGKGGALDSMALVSLVIAIEQAIAEEYGATLALADERAMSRSHSPFRTVGSLAAYAGELYDEEAGR